MSNGHRGHGAPARLPGGGAACQGECITSNFHSRTQHDVRRIKSGFAAYCPDGWYGLAWALTICRLPLALAAVLLLLIHENLPSASSAIVA